MRKFLLSLVYNNESRSFLFQLIIVVFVLGFFYNFANNAITNIEERGINVGFGFLNSESGFAIAETLIEYDESSSIWRVFFVGILNTLYVSIVGIIFASLIGLTIGVARLSANWLIRKLSHAYIEIFRNIPILLQILFWYNIIITTFPPLRQSFSFYDSVFINARGFYLPKPLANDTFIWFLLAVVLLMFVWLFMKKYTQKKQKETGVISNTLPHSIVLLLVLPVLIYYLMDPLAFSLPALSGFNFEGGLSITPEFLALAFALSIYTATYIAEAIRSGIEAVNKGQREAALALNLTSKQTLKLIVMPQALRIAVPPIINQYLNLTKNSSLAVAIGYPDIVGVFAGTTLSKIGQALEIIAMTMLVYLTISLLISLALNAVNHKLKIIER